MRRLTSLARLARVSPQRPRLERGREHANALWIVYGDVRLFILAYRGVISAGLTLTPESGAYLERR